MWAIHETINNWYGCGKHVWERVAVIESGNENGDRL